MEEKNEQKTENKTNARKMEIVGSELIDLAYQHALEIRESTDFIESDESAKNIDAISVTLKRMSEFGVILFPGEVVPKEKEETIVEEVIKPISNNDKKKEEKLDKIKKDLGKKKKGGK